MSPNPALRVTSWSSADVPVLRQIVPMVWTWTSRPADPGKVAQGLRSRPPGSRVLHIFHPLKVPNVVNAFDQTDPALLVRRGSLVGPEHLAYYTRLFAQIHDAGGRIDRIVIDYEFGGFLWHFGNGEQRVEKMRAILSDRTAKARLPEVVTSLPPEAYRDSNKARAAYIAFNQFAAEQRALAIEKMIVRPARAVFGDGFRVSNYNDLRPSFEVYDRNGWPIQHAACGTDDSPELYLLRDGNRYKRHKKPARWNRFIDCLNIIRSVAHTGYVSPWISAPGYQRLHRDPDADAFLWVSMILHLMHTGVRDFILWNPTSLARAGRDTVMMDDMFTALAGSFGSGNGMLEGLPPIELDSEVVRTGEYVTTYEDFLDHDPDAES